MKKVKFKELTVLKRQRLLGYPMVRYVETKVLTDLESVVYPLERPNKGV